MDGYQWVLNSLKTRITLYILLFFNPHFDIEFFFISLNKTLLYIIHLFSIQYQSEDKLLIDICYHQEMAKSLLWNSTNTNKQFNFRHLEENDIFDNKKMSFSIILWHDNKSVKLVVPGDMPVIELIKENGESLGLDKDFSEYVFLCPDEVEINESPIGSFLKQQENIPLDVHVANKSEIKKVDEFCKLIFPSLKYEAIMTDARLYQAINQCHIIHQNVISIYNEKKDFKSLVPASVYEGKSDIELLRSITKWFAESSFMKYMEKPKCPYCQIPMMYEDSNGFPTQKEMDRGARHDRRYKCSKCQARKRIPLYENPETLLETREGMSCEFSIMLGTILRQFGFEIRIVKSSGFGYFWLEAYVESLQHYVHVDELSGIIDSPLQIEEGSKVRIQYVIAVGMYDCMDVTPRYTRNIDRILWDRNKKLPEEYFQQAISFKNELWASDIPPEKKDYYQTIFFNEQMHNSSPDREPTEDEMKPIPYVEMY